MVSEYNPAEIEPKFQQRWTNENAFAAPDNPERPTWYCLSMFPYPSGRLHMGHVRNYTIGDVVSRYRRMKGYDVLQPMGWDAFGLPAENAAMKNNVPPAAWTKENIAYMKNQLIRLGFGYDWDREVATCHPEYYRWEQWFFTRLLEKGLVYRKESEVNWDPIDQTVLANEQVIDGRGWRSGALVEKRKIPQWFIRITAYAQELLDDLEQLTEWPEQVRTMQKNWIGRSRGLEIQFLANEDGEDPIKVFTTRPDTLMGVSAVAVSADHPLAIQAAETNDHLHAFLDECSVSATAEAEMAKLEKKGMPLGVDVLHPITKRPVPVWVANFVLSSYGTGAVMMVPAHDQRDWEFAQAYQLPIQQVIEPESEEPIDLSTAAFTEKGKLVNSGSFDGLNFEEAFNAIRDELVSHDLGEEQINFRLRDWGVSRQRYWGTPIPVIHCKDCGAVPVPEKDLPVVLPEDVSFSEDGGSPIKKMASFIETTCPKCGSPAERETDTFDTFMESSWYYARYASRDNNQAMLDERADRWCPVDQYIGGIEHAILHLLYARFFHKLMRDEGLVSSDEPFKRLLCQGMVIAETWSSTEDSGRINWHSPTDVQVQRDDKGRILSGHLADGTPVEFGGVTKMSKSKNNGIDPQTMIDQHGADTVRLFMMFAAPPEQSLEWSDTGVEGAHRFLRRLWRTVQEHLGHTPKPATPEAEKVVKGLRRKAHLCLEKVTDDFHRRMTINTAIAAVMELINEVNRVMNGHQSQAWGSIREAIEIALLTLSPVTPHICEQLWQELGHEDSIVNASWPEIDQSALVQDEITLVVQVNGKRRANLSLPADADQAQAEALALDNENIHRHTEGKTIRKIIFIPGKLMNIVVSN